MWLPIKVFKDVFILSSLILKLRCLVIVFPLGLNNKMSVLLVLRLILFDLGHWTRSVKSWFTSLTKSSRLHNVCFANVGSLFADLRITLLAEIHCLDLTGELRVGDLPVSWSCKFHHEIYCLKLSYKTRGWVHDNFLCASCFFSLNDGDIELHLSNNECLLLSQLRPDRSLI